MNYKKCPRCELNYITESEELCTMCRQQTKVHSCTKRAETDFSRIVYGCVYGTNSRKIYEKFCDTLSWDKSKANQFGARNTPLYASNADTNRINDVWFICYYDSVVNINHLGNFILDNGNTIVEKVATSLGNSNNSNRITFLKTKSGYKFLGVYQIVENGTTRVFQRISNNYPITN